MSCEVILLLFVVSCWLCMLYVLSIGSQLLRLSFLFAIESISINKCKGWDLTSGEKIGTVSCHYGQVTFDETTGEQGTVKSCVVGIQIGNGRLISLCRDGVLAEWVFEEDNKTKSAIV